MYFLHAVPHSMTFPPFSSISMGQTSWERQFRTALTAACPLTPHYQFKLLTTQPHCSYSLLLVNWSKENHAGIHKHTQRHMHTHTTMGDSSSDDPLQKKVLSEAVLCMLELLTLQQSFIVRHTDNHQCLACCSGRVNFYFQLRCIMQCDWK